MKHKGLFITIILCIVVFLSSLTAGIILTVRDVGWSSLLDSSKLQQRLDYFINSFQIPGFFPINRQTFSLDELKTFDLSGIDTITVSGTSESVILTAGGTQVEARLKGTYQSFGPQITWEVEKQGSELLIHPNYHHIGLIKNNLAIAVQVPADFTGEVQLHTISGNCTGTGKIKTNWSKMKLSVVSGNLKIEQAAIPEITFSSISGSVVFLDCSAKVSGNSVSGNVNVAWTAAAESTIDTVSGKVTLALPAESDCLISFTTVSGSFTNDGLPINISKQTKRNLTGSMNQGNIPFKIKTVSGDLVMSSS